jgi:hypothetical protein
MFLPRIQATQTREQFTRDGPCLSDGPRIVITSSRARRANRKFASPAQKSAVTSNVSVPKRGLFFGR